MITRIKLQRNNNNNNNMMGKVLRQREVYQCVCTYIHIYVYIIL